MNDRHVIHLGGGWEPPRGGASGTWRRHFGRPSGIGPGDRLWLVIDRPAACRLVLNAAALAACPGGPTAYRAEVTMLLGDRNLLTLETTHRAADHSAGDDGGRRSLPDPLGRISLEIVPASTES